MAPCAFPISNSTYEAHILTTALTSCSNTCENALGTVVYVDMPEVDDDVEAGSAFGAVESVKPASDLISPVTGVVVEVNSELEDTPELINSDAFANWIIKVKIADMTELDNLMNAQAYAELCEKEAH